MASRFDVTKEKLDKVDKKYSHLTNRTKAHTVYTDSKGNRLLSVTTILKLIPKFALMAWAHNLGLVKQDYNKVRQESADIGTAVHNSINDDDSSWVHSLPYADMIERGVSSFENYHNFIKFRNVKILKQEMSLTYDGDDNTPAFGGTCDMVAEVDDKLSLVDFKTGNAIYPESVLQLAAYDLLLRVKGIEVEQYCLARIPNSKTQKPEVLMYEPQDDFYISFILLAKTAYSLEKSIGLSLHAKGAS